MLKAPALWLWAYYFIMMSCKWFYGNTDVNVDLTLLQIMWIISYTVVMRMEKSLKHNFWNAWFHFLHSHSKPVVLRALPPLDQLKAAELKDVEKTVAHHVGDGVISIEKALFKSKRDKTGRYKAEINTICIIMPNICPFCVSMAAKLSIEHNAFLFMHSELLWNQINYHNWNKCIVASEKKKLIYWFH